MALGIKNLLNAMSFGSLLLLQGIHPIIRNADQDVSKTDAFNKIILTSKFLESPNFKWKITKYNFSKRNCYTVIKNIFKENLMSWGNCGEKNTT